MFRMFVLHSAKGLGAFGRHEQREAAAGSLRGLRGGRTVSALVSERAARRVRRWARARARARPLQTRVCGGVWPAAVRDATRLAGSARSLAAVGRRTPPAANVAARTRRPASASHAHARRNCRHGAARRGSRAAHAHSTGA